MVLYVFILYFDTFGFIYKLMLNIFLYSLQFAPLYLVSKEIVSLFTKISYLTYQWLLNLFNCSLKKTIQIISWQMVLFRVAKKLGVLEFDILSKKTLKTKNFRNIKIKTWIF